jgi:D-alanyl-D-alanine carboxypeptidase
MEPLSGEMGNKTMSFLQRRQSAFRSTALAVLILAFCNGAASALPAPTTSFAPATVKAINGAITAWFATYKAPGVIVGIWIPGKGSFVAALGKGDRATGAPMRLDDHMRIGSVTKTFTITVLLQLVDKKLARLDDPVSKYVSYVPNGQKITLGMLANMTAGLFNYTEDDNFGRDVSRNPQRVWTPRELVDIGLRHPPYFPPGAGWHYSNTNTVLLGILIEKILGKPISAIYQQYIFSPLGLANTMWPMSSSLPSPFARGVTETADGKVVDATNSSPSEASTAGQLVSTLADMKVWAKACAIGAQISPALQRQRLTWVTLPPMTPQTKYGLGILYNHGWIGHNGSIPGYTSEVVYLPSHDATMVLLVSSDIEVDKKTPVAALLNALTKIVTPQNVAG